MRFILLLILIVPFLSEAKPHWSDAILADVQRIYTSVSQQQNQKFELQIRYNDFFDGASADSDGKTHIVTISNGLFLNPKFNPDALRIIVCHELGHIFGGSPRRNVPFEWTGIAAHDSLSFMSSEGQADYYASAVCFRELVKSQNNKIAISKLKLNSTLTSMCDNNWGKNSEESAICQRANLAAETFLKLSHNYDISFEHPDMSINPILIRDQYPARQCRLDTFVRGSLCKSKKPLQFDFYNSEKNECQNKEGQRPSCWYR